MEKSRNDVVATSIYQIGLVNHSLDRRNKGIAEMVEKYTLAELEFALVKWDNGKRIHCGGGFEEQRANYKKGAVISQIKGAIVLKNGGKE